MTHYTGSTTVGNYHHIMIDRKSQDLLNLINAIRSCHAVWKALQNTATQTNPIRQALSMGVVKP